MFEESIQQRVQSWDNSGELRQISHAFTGSALRAGYTYNFTWLGAKIIQFPEDIINLQEIIIRTKPNVIVETGVAQGGSSLFFASILHLNSLYTKDSSPYKYIGIDLHLNQETCNQLNSCPFADNIHLVESDSTHLGLQSHLKTLLSDQDRVMVVLDSCHTTKHVEREITNLAPLVTQGCYLVVCDTSVGIVGPAYENCRYGVTKANSPLQALASLSECFVEDRVLHLSQLASGNYYGYYTRK